jgi:hypothetical protein
VGEAAQLLGVSTCYVLLDVSRTPDTTDAHSGRNAESSALISRLEDEVEGSWRLFGRPRKIVAPSAVL